MLVKVRLWRHLGCSASGRQWARWARMGRRGVFCETWHVSAAMYIECQCGDGREGGSDVCMHGRGEWASGEKGPCQEEDMCQHVLSLVMRPKLRW